MKRSILVLGAALLLATSATPALADATIGVPLAAAPSLDPQNANAFNGAATVPIAWDATDAQRAGEPATVRLLSDASALYVRFDVTQERAPLMGLAGGDSVAVDLWPAGESRTHYHLGVGLDGTHTADSTPDTAAWKTAVSSHAGGYTVTMKIPLSAIGTTAPARVQFSRWIASTGQEDVWSHRSGGSVAEDDLAQAGTLTLPASVGKN